MTAHLLNRACAACLLRTHRVEEEQQIKEILEQDAIQHSTSPWCSLAILVKKKSTRNCVRPLPRISNILDILGDAKYFSILDLRNDNWQIPVAPEDWTKTAFATPSGLYELDRMSFCLSTAPVTFQRSKEIVLARLNFVACLCYLDDVVVWGRTIQEHNERLRAVLSRFSKDNLRAKLFICTFAATQVAIL